MRWTTKRSIGAQDELFPQWVDTDTGELFEGGVELNDAQRLHLLRLLPDGSPPADSAPEVDEQRPQPAPANAAVTTATPAPSR